MPYPSIPMTRDQIDTFLHEVRNAIIGTNRRDGSPQLSSVWYVYNLGVVYIGFEAGSAKDHNIKRDPRVTVCVDGGSSDSRTVTIYGVAEFVAEDDPRFTDIREQIELRYNDTPDEEQPLQDIPVDNGRRMIAVRPEKILARDYN